MNHILISPELFNGESSGRDFRDGDGTFFIVPSYGADIYFRLCWYGYNYLNN